VTDPRNLGAVVRSSAAFGATGVVVPARRSAGVTAGAWKASAGALARLPVARAVNLTRTLRAYQEADGAAEHRRYRVDRPVRDRHGAVSASMTSSRPV
jgi:tRNA G18 (ribose-2'-O)-methylase SpoU